MRNHVRFRSPVFVVSDAPHDDPGAASTKLASWLAQCLRTEGLRVVQPVQEDWGSLLSIEHPSSTWVGCGRVDGELDQWLCFCEAKPSLLARFLRRTKGDVVARRAVTALASALASDPTVYEVEWFAVDGSGQERDHAATPA